MQLVYDIEANGLLDKVTKIWCIFGIDIVTNEQYLFHDFEGFCNQVGVDDLNKEFTIPAKKGSLKDGVAFLSNTKNLICHNQLGYDQFLIKKFYPDFKIRYNYPEIRDTLLESQVQWFDRKPVKGYKGIHGLAVWGARLGIRKPEIEDWSTFDIQKLNRCIEDVKINVLVAKALEQERYKLLSECGIEFDQALKYEHEYRYFCTKQELAGALVDPEHMKRCLVELDQYIDELTRLIEPKLPPTIIVKGGKVTKQDLFSSLGLKKKVPTQYVEKEVKGELKLYPVKDWYKPVTKYLTEKVVKKYQVQLKGSDKPLEMVFDKLKEAKDFAKSVYPNEKVTYPSYEETVTAFTKHTEDHFGESLKNIKIVGPHTKIDAEPSTMSQDDKVKMYLLSLGWKTDEWTIAKDEEGNFKVADRSGVVKWPEVPYMGLQLEKEYKPGDKVPATPKVSKESLATLEDGLGDDIKKYNTYVHRRNFICNKKDNTKGLLNNIREDGRVTCGLTSFGTTAGRATHYNFVNAPSSSVLYGKEIRKIIVAAPNHTLIGVDMPSAHPRLLADFTNNNVFVQAVDGYEDDPVTGEYVGEDFHTVNSVTFDLASKEDVQKAAQTQDKELIEKLKKARKKGKGGTYACVPVDTTQVLTKDGWKYYGELSLDDKVLSLNNETNLMEFVDIGATHFIPNAKTTIIKDKHSLHLESTNDHRWLVDKRKFVNNKRTIVREYWETQNLNSECSIIRNGNYNFTGREDITDDEARLLGWILSDGCVSWSPFSTKTSSSFGTKRGVSAVVVQAEHKYVEEIDTLFQRLGCGTVVKYSVSRGVNSPKRTYTINANYFRGFWSKMGFSTQEKKDINLEQWVLSVGTKTLECFLEAFYLGDGHIDKLNVKHITQNDGKILDGVYLACYLTGYVPTKSVKLNDKNLCYNVRLRTRKHSTLQNMQKLVNYRSTDVFCLTTRNSNFVIKQGDCITITGNCLYGGSGTKIGFVLGKSPEEGNRLKEKFLSVLGLDSVLEDVLQYWESRKWNRGSYIEVLGGYWVWCSSKHKIINYKALGSEAVMQKIAIILLNRKFEALNLKTKQILNMHDEALFEVPDNEIDIAKPLIENMYKEAATYLNLKLDWTSVAKTGSNYYECH